MSGRCVIVQGFPAFCPIDCLWEYFTKFGTQPQDGAISHIEGSTDVCVRFETRNDTLKVLSEKNHECEVGGRVCNLTIKECIHDRVEKEALDKNFSQQKTGPYPGLSTDQSANQGIPTNRIRVTNFGPKILSQTLSLYFEGHRLGGEVEEVFLDKKHNQAFVTFKDIKVAERMSRCHDFVLDDSRLYISLIYDDPPVEATVSQDPAGATSDPSTISMQQSLSTSCSVHVKVPADQEHISSQVLHMFFQNSTRSGGGTVRDVYHELNTSNYVINFQEPGVAARVCQRDHIYEGHKWCVTHLPSRTKNIPAGQIEPGSYIALLNLTRDITRMSLILYLETSATEFKIKDIVYGLDPKICILKFQNDAYFEAVLDHLSRYSLCGTMLEAKVIPPTTKCQVTNIKDISHETLYLFFESPSRSGGEYGVRVKVLEEDPNCAIISCPSQEIMNRILKRQHHRVNKQDLHVRIYYDILGISPPGTDTSHPVWIPTYTKVSQISLKILQFLRSSRQARQDVERALSQVHGQVNWDKSDGDNGLYITCLLSGMSRQALIAGRKWHSQVQEAVNSVIDMCCEKNIKNSSRRISLADAFKMSLEKNQLIVSGEVLHHLDASADSATFVGYKHNVIQVVNELQDFIQERESKLLRLESVTQDFIRLQPYHAQYIEFFKFGEEIKSRWNVDGNLDLAKNLFIMEGTEDELKNAKLWLYPQLHSVQRKTQILGKYRIQLLSLPLVVSYMKDLLARKGIKVFCSHEVQKEYLMLHFISEDDFNRALPLYEDELTSEVIPLVGPALQAMKTPKWQRFIADLQSELAENTIITEDSERGQVRITTQANTIACLKARLDKFLNENCVIGDNEDVASINIPYNESPHLTRNENPNTSLSCGIAQCNLPPEVVEKLIWGTDRIDTIVTTLSDYDVSITPVEGDASLFSIYGKQDGVALAQGLLEDLETQVVSRSVVINKDNIKQIFSEHFINTVEEACNVKIIKTTIDPSSSEFHIYGLSGDSVDLALEEYIEKRKNENIQIYQFGGRNKATEASYIENLRANEKDHIQDLEKKYDVHVAIMMPDGEDYAAQILVSGPTDPLSTAVENIATILHAVQVRTERLNSWSQAAPSGTRALYVQGLVGGVRVAIYTHDLTEFNTDIKVAPASRSLTHPMVKAAGAEITKLCDDYIKAHGNLTAGDVFITGGGDVNCEHIFHAVGPNWNSYTNKTSCKEDLKLIFNNVFEKARGLPVEPRTIAIPCIGAGINGVPKDEVAKALCNAIFYHAQHRKPPKDILIVNRRQELTEEVINVFKQKFGERQA